MKPIKGPFFLTLCFERKPLPKWLWGLENSVANMVVFFSIATYSRILSTGAAKCKGR